jgi:voltage-gated potassium channel
MMKTRIFELVQKGSHGQKSNLIFDYSILTLIILSVISIVLESIPEIYKEIGEQLRVFNIFTIIIFTIEYLLRLYVSDLTHPTNSKIKSALKFIFSGYGLIDLLAILPFYIPMLIKVDLRFLRILRLTRILRILKVNRYNNSLILIGTVIKEKRSELTVSGFVTLLLLILASFIMYYVEGSAQPEAFPNILSALWWAVATLTTVGYGDIYPVTGLGKIISGFIALLGIGLVALPTGLISAGFISKLENKKSDSEEKRCPHCGELIE